MKIIWLHSRGFSTAMSEEEVFLNVYDMNSFNEYASSVGFGVYHSGIEVYGVEYAFGGHPYQFSGIFESTPQDADELGENFRFRENIRIGATDFSESDMKNIIKYMGHEYAGCNYHLISKNCNHFSSALAKILTGEEIPSWINRLAFVSGSIPFLERCIPHEWLTPVALKNCVEKRIEGGGLGKAEVEEAVEITEDLLWSTRSTDTTQYDTSSMNSGLPNQVSSTSTLSRLWNSVKNFAVNQQQPELHSSR